jgi:phosphoribosylamine--glycine ligase
MNVLVIGSGGREHAISWKLSQSPALTTLYIAPGNAGTREVGENVDLNINDPESVAKFCTNKAIDMLVIGPEAPLADGLVDDLEKFPELSELAIIGPKKAGAELEASKDFAKIFMKRHNIPTAGYETFTKETLQTGLKYLESIKGPYVLKADGLAAGKGVIITEELEQAKKSLTEMLADAKFGDASSKVVIEEFLAGIELSVFVLTDGKEYFILPEAKDYKRIGEGDTGLNTGGMGAVSPVPFATKAFMKKIEDRVIAPTIEGLQKDNIEYKGFIFFGLIKVNDDPYVIEYNVRMGDPETQVVIPRLKNDLLDVFGKVHTGGLSDIKPEFDDQAATTVVLVSGGYPEAYAKGKVITKTEDVSDVQVFHAGTAEKDGNVVTNGGRVLNLTAKGATIEAALEKSKKAANTIEFEGKYFRSDIGLDVTQDVLSK